ncbi:MAG: ABC transporter ATP-binding protein [bacterium]
METENKAQKITIKDLWMTIKKVLQLSFKVDRKRFWIILLTNIFLAIFATISAWYFSRFLNIAIYNNGERFFSNTVIFTLLIIISARILNSILSTWNWRVYSFFSRKFFTETFLLSAQASERIDIQTYESPGFSLLRTRVSMYFGKLQNYGDVLTDCINSLIPMLISTVIILSIGKWWLLLLVIIPAILNFWTELLDGKTMWDCENQAGEERKKFSAFYNFFGSKNYVEEIKINGLKPFFLKGIIETRETINAIFLKRDNAYMKKKLIVNIITNIMELVVPIVLIHQIFTKQLLIGAFYFINGRFDTFTNNLRQMLRTLGRMYKDAPYVSDIFKFIEMQPVLPNGKSTLSTFESLQIKNVDFTYPESDRVILEGLNFEIKRGEKVAMIGLNGAGKTTITKLLLRFYFSTKGDVLYNGNKIEDLDKYNLYQKIGFLPQDFAKFDLTFEESIALGNMSKDFNSDKVIESAKKAHIHEFIMSHPNGYQTQIGKKYKDGVELSGGQWQKLAIASMFYRNAEFWILDEPTSAIDAEAEANIFEELEKLPDDITVLMISHRFSTVRNADRIIVVGEGKVHEQGTHEELLKLKKGEYARLFKLQAEGYK